MVALSYAAKLSELAKSLGLGRRAEVTPAEKASREAAAPEQAVPAKLKRGRKRADAAR